MEKLLVLDLEDTVCEPVIAGWHSTSLLPREIDRIKRFIEAWQPDSVSLFSFAVHDEADRLQFLQYMQPPLETALGIRFAEVPTVLGSIREACAKEHRMAPSKLTFSDMVEFWGKAISFELFCQNRARKAKVPTHFVLIDDAVPDAHRVDFRTRCETSLVNVERIQEAIARMS